MPAWLVLGAGMLEAGVRGIHGSTVTPLVGRSTRKATEPLLRRWAQAKAGSGRVVLISAEPGVGNRAWPRRWPNGSAPNHIPRCATSAHRTIRIAHSIR